MRKAGSNSDELRTEYKRSDFGKLEREKYYQRVMERSNVVVLDAEVAKVFPNSTAVNKRAARKLEYLDLATSLEDLKVPPGNRLHALTGNRKGQYSISVNDQWRICFRFVDGDAYDVEICDCH